MEKITLFAQVFQKLPKDLIKSLVKRRCQASYAIELPYDTP